MPVRNADSQFNEHVLLVSTHSL